MSAATSTLDRAGFGLILSSLAIVQFNLLAAQVLFGLAAICWLVGETQDGWRTSWPAFAWPLGGYALMTLVSSAFSLRPGQSFYDSRQLLLFLVVPIVMRFARGERAARIVDAIMALGAAGALVGIVEFAMLGYDNLDKRPMGMLSHYMTYAGVLMLVTCAAAARLLFYPARRIWPGVAVPALMVALALTLTINAYVGTAASLICLLALRDRRLLLVIPIVAVVGLLIAPAQVRDRVLSISPQQDSNRDRLQMLEMGRDMVRDHPLFGVGPEMVGIVYPQYLRPNPVHVYNPHLHNVPMQIAAERGLPALFIWLAFIVTALVGEFRLMRAGTSPAIAAAGLAAIVAMLSAGLFEYNFGDSEFLMLFLGLITLPFAAQELDSRPARAQALAA